MNNVLNSIIMQIRKLRIFRSFQVRIFILMLIIGIVPSIIVHRAILQNYETRAVSVRTDEVSNQLVVIANHLLIVKALIIYTHGIESNIAVRRADNNLLWCCLHPL